MLDTITTLGLLAAAPIAVVAVWLLIRMVQMLLQLRQIAAGLRREVGHLLADSSRRGDVIDGTLVVDRREIGSG